MFLLFRCSFRRFANHKIALYIPICFYYFGDKITELGDKATLHSNMFLLFLSKAGVPSSTITLYIPICFYYFCECDDEDVIVSQFTFQYVSIISRPM